MKLQGALKKRQATWTSHKGPAAFAVLLGLIAALSGLPALAADDVPSPAPRPGSVILPERKPPVPAAKSSSAPTPAAASPALDGTALDGTALGPTLTMREKEIFSQAVKAATRREWSRARATVATARHPLLSKIIEWAFLREPGPHADFAARTRFLTANPLWPNANDIRRRAEDAIDRSVPVADLAAWFETHPPLSTAGKVAYAGVLASQSKTAEARALARGAWISGAFSRDEERDFLQKFGSILTAEDYWARIDRILYDEQTTAATRLLRYVDPGRAQLARARIALIAGARNTEAAIAAVPPALQNDPGLLYERIRWRREHDNEAGARQLVPPFAAGGPRPDLWWRERQALARDALAKGEISEAYALSKHHGTTDALSVSEAEWLAGWIALRFLKDGEAALAHFQRVYDAVQTPPSVARGAYWTGRTTEFLGRADLAAEWYQRAATHVTTYYGQLALARLRGDGVPQLPQDPAPTAEERSAFNSSELTQALRVLMEVDAKTYQRAFAQALADNAASASDRHMTAELLSRRARVDLGVVVARQAARDKIMLVQYGYPTPAYAYPGTPEKALILAVARQESNFDVDARSSAGARGLMQLMPPTARAVAKATKQAYAEKRLTADPGYNIRLGSGYLNTLLSTFDGSYVLAAAAYNAGPNRARQWIRQFGDPRDAKIDAIDWVEQIPFSETRNYVQRVMENVMIYRAVLGGVSEVQRTLERELVRHEDRRQPD